MNILSEYWITRGSKIVQIHDGLFLLFELDNKHHQYTVKQIKSFTDNFNKYNERGETLFKVTKKKGDTILKFFSMLSEIVLPGVIEKSLDNSSKDNLKNFRPDQVCDEVERKFELTTSIDRQQVLEDIERIFDIPSILRNDLENIFEDTPARNDYGDVENNLEVPQQNYPRGDVEDYLDITPDVDCSKENSKSTRTLEPVPKTPPSKMTVSERGKESIPKTSVIGTPHKEGCPFKEDHR